MRGEDEQVGAREPGEDIVALPREQQRIADAVRRGACLKRGDPRRVARADDDQAQGLLRHRQRGGVDQALEVFLGMDAPDRHMRVAACEPGVRGGAWPVARAGDVDTIGDMDALPAATEA